MSLLQRFLVPAISFNDWDARNEESFDFDEDIEEKKYPPILNSAQRRESSGDRSI